MSRISTWSRQAGPRRDQVRPVGVRNLFVAAGVGDGSTVAVQRSGSPIRSMARQRADNGDSRERHAAARPGRGHAPKNLQITAQEIEDIEERSSPRTPVISEIDRDHASLHSAGPRHLRRYGTVRLAVLRRGHERDLIRGVLRLAFDDCVLTIAVARGSKFGAAASENALRGQSFVDPAQFPGFAQ